ncbi:unnamed protein product [Didymodactylos carnosus]|uniref:Polymerase nucleotidyl transferase domain-containing protein n=1 Tax=Didymodactylos carnosus TaxID=1234261 RepID=A0A815K1J6_9BILA|nr:unnamed protein product [Didymodactylos carnosus]CAF4281591.1 unnamed protein product [Didymodactylos carnosus]
MQIVSGQEIRNLLKVFMEKIVSALLNELKLDDNQITNIYNYGSWVYGTNHEKSDHDFLIVMKNEKQRKYLKFRKYFDYFHIFELHRLNKCDITIYSCENFELLLKKNYMLAVECLFYPNEFILRNNIDYKSIYLSKYYNPLRLKQVTFYENNYSFNSLIDDDARYPNSSQSKTSFNPTIDQFLCDACHTTTLDEDRSLKHLFHGLRYLDIGEQLIQTKSIYDFKRVSHVLYEIKDIYINNNKSVDFVIDYLKMKSGEYKTIMNKLVPTNVINGTFEVHITVENNDMEHFLNVCKINKLKSIFIHLNNGNNPKQLMTSSYHVGTYSNIVEEIKTLANIQFKDFNIIRLKIESLPSNNGIPENDIDKLLFWDINSNYFEFHYKILISSLNQLRRLKKLCITYELYLARNAFKTISINEMYYIITMRLFNVSRVNAFIRNDTIINYLTMNHFPPLKVEREFVVYDSNIDLDNGWSHTRNECENGSTKTSTGSKYRIGSKNRKFFRSGD